MSSTRTKRFLGGVGYGYFFQALVILAGLWLPPFLLRNLGSESYGSWIVGLQIISYLALLDFGLVSLLPREMAARLALSETAPATLAGETLVALLCQLPLVAAGALLCWWAMPEKLAPLREPLGLVLLAFVLLFPLRAMPAFLQGMQDLAYLGRLHILAWALGTITTVLLVLSGLGMRALPVGWVAQQALLTGVSAWRWKTHFKKYWPPKRPRFQPKEMRSLIGQGIWVNLAQIATVIVQGADVLIVGWLLGPQAAVIYSCTAKIALVLANQPQILLVSALPGLSELRSTGNRERLIQVTTALRDGILIGSGAIVCVGAAINEGFVRWWVGPQYYGGLALTLSVLMAMLLRHWNATLSLTMFSLGMERRMFVTLMIDGALTIAATIFFVQRGGLVGGPLGSILGVLLISLPANVLAVSRELGITPGQYLGTLIPWIARLAVIGCLLFATLPLIGRADGLLSLAVASAAVASVYGLMFLPAALRSPLGTYLRPLIAR